MAGKATDSEQQPPDFLSANDMEDEDRGEWYEEEDEISTLPKAKSAEILEPDRTVDLERRLLWDEPEQEGVNRQK